MTGGRLLHALLNLPFYLNTLLVVGLSALLAWASVSLVRRRLPQPAYKGNNELVGFTYAVYGVIYGVLLAFTIIVAWERYEDTEQLVLDEATILSELWRDSMAFPPVIRDEIQNALVAYAQSVIDDEWPAMAARGQHHIATEEIYARLWSQSYRIEPANKNQEAYLAELLARMNELSGTRRLRILHSRMEGHIVLWMVLLVGAIPTVGYTLLFSNQHVWVQMAIAGSVLLIVLLCLLVTLILQHPFIGDLALEPKAFENLLESFRQRLLLESGRIGP